MNKMNNTNNMNNMNHASNMNHGNNKNKKSPKDTPVPNTKTNLFEGLSSFGLNAVEDIKVYDDMDQNGNQKTEQDEKSKLEEAIRKNVFLRKFKCPVCGVETKVPDVSSSSIRLERRDTDLMPIYREPNPLYYYVVFCKNCGFATIPANVKNITERQRALIVEKVSKTWRFEKEYPIYYTPEIAVEVHKLGLLNAIVSNDKESLRAIISLHIGWLYRIAGDSTNELMFLKTALEGFQRAYEREPGMVGGMDNNNQEYLIGELMRRTGDLHGALEWFKRVLLSTTATQRLKDMTRDQKDLIIAAINDTQ